MKNLREHGSTGKIYSTRRTAARGFPAKGRYISPMLTSFLNAADTFRATVSAHPVFGIGILLMGSWFLGRVAANLRLPSITGFILAGMVLGPGMLGLVHPDLRDELGIITEVALAVIALVIGSEFSAAKLRKTGRPVIIITTVQLLLTFLAVALALFLSGVAGLSLAVILAAIATATAPAATVAIVRELKARGPFVDHLYGIVALDDAGCVLIFSLAMALAGNTVGAAGAGPGAALLHGMYEIGGSLALGVAIGWIMRLLTGKNPRTNEIYIISLGLLCIMTAAAATFGFSPLLAGMAAGAVLANSPGGSRRVVGTLEQISPPMYAAFFAIAGSELNLGYLFRGGVLLMGLVYVLTRAAGKYFGVRLGAGIAGSDPLIRRYLGFAMLPQAGVAIGLALFVQSSPVLAGNPHLAATIVSVTLFSVFVNEITGPPVSRYALVRGATL